VYVEGTLPCAISHLHHASYRWALLFCHRPNIVIICRLQHGFQLCKLHIATMNVDCNMALLF
jgi:hypothetical protein